MVSSGRVPAYRPFNGRPGLVHSFGKDVWVHSCGCITRVIPSLIEMGLDVLNPIQPECMDPLEVKEKYGDRIVLHGCGGLQKTLPFGTKVRVTNLENGKKAVLRINDRGPFVEGRIIDVSLMGAKELDFVSEGVVRVRVEILGE